MAFVELEDDLHGKLEAIWLEYQIDRRPESKTEYLKLLKQFSDLILRGKGPIRDEG